MMPRRVGLLLACCAPFGWLAFWAVFHTVPGQDWMVFHTAALLARSRDWHTLADPQAFTDLLNWTHRAWLGQPLKFHPWVYPPVTLLLSLAFGGMGYPWSLGIFLAVTLAAMLAALWPWRPDARGRALLFLFVLICPATAFNLGAGQLGFLVASCVAGGVYFLPLRPALGGALLGLLCLKPQFAPMVPVALVAGRHWRGGAGAAWSIGLLTGLSLLLVGVHVWEDWVRLALGGTPARGEWADAVRLYSQSVRACLRVLGAGGTASAIGQLAALALSATCVWRVFAKRASAKGASAQDRLVVLLCATVFGAPHVGDYDHVLVAIAATLVLLDRPRRLPMVFAAGAWLATMFNPPGFVGALGFAPLTALSALTPGLVAGLMVRVAWAAPAAGEGVRPGGGSSLILMSG